MNQQLSDLAALERKCATCGGVGELGGSTPVRGGQAIVVPQCPACHGTGKVPLVPGLLRPCEFCSGQGKQFPSPPCMGCANRCWLPVPEQEAAWVLLQWLRENCYQYKLRVSSMEIWLPHWHVPPTLGPTCWEVVNDGNDVEAVIAAAHAALVPVPGAKE